MENKTPEEILIKNFPDDESGFQYNTLDNFTKKYIISAMKEYGKQQYNQAIKNAAENATTIDVGTLTDEGWMPFDIVDKDSILKLIKE